MPCCLLIKGNSKNSKNPLLPKGEGWGEGIFEVTLKIIVPVRV
mgnify:CR=1 FL=1